MSQIGDLKAGPLSHLPNLDRTICGYTLSRPPHTTWMRESSQNPWWHPSDDDLGWDEPFL